MQCTSCDKKAIFSSPKYCKEHFMTYVENLVKDTIKKYKLCKKSDVICVAASGGKDSAALLVILKKLGYKVEALAIDEGIKGYRDASLEDLKKLTGKHDIPLKVVSFEEEVGKPLDDMVKNRYPCSVCGVFRRQLLNKYSKGYAVIATGHNLDDESQAVLMNLMKANTRLLHRTFIRTPDSNGFTVRIKPLAFLTEKQIRAYTLLGGFDISYDECPHVHASLRAQVRDALNDYELAHQGMKSALLEAALYFHKEAKEDIGKCIECGEPSAAQVCRACTLKKEIGGVA